MKKLLTNALAFLFLVSFARAQNPCDEVFDAGLIGPNQIIYAGNIPDLIENEGLPTGGTIAAYEYMWLWTTFEPGGTVDIWYALHDDTDLSYQPEALNETTWFRRCVRQVGCETYTSETNIVKVEVLDCDPSLGANIVTTDITCYGSSDGTATLSSTGIHTGFAIKWGDGNTEWERTGLMAGVYPYTITDGVGCEMEDFIRIGAPAELLLSVDRDTLDCFTETGTLIAQAQGGTVPYSYQWLDVSGNLLSEENFLYATEGTYFLWTTDANGCAEETETELIRECGEINFVAPPSPTDRGVLIEWSLPYEPDESFYLVERGPDSTRMETISDAIPATGVAESVYGFIDKDPGVGIQVYRIKNVDRRGNVIFSNWLPTDDDSTGAVLFPNPSYGPLQIDLMRPVEQNVPYRIFDARGREARQEVIRTGERFVTVDTRDLPTGVYRLMLMENGKRPRILTFQMIK